MIFRTQFFRLGFGQGIYQLYVNNILYTILSGKYDRFYFLKKYNHISESPWATVIITYLLDFRSKIGKYYKMRASLRQNWFNIHFSEHNDPLTTKKTSFFVRIYLVAKHEQNFVGQPDLWIIFCRF